MQTTQPENVRARGRNRNGFAVSWFLPVILGGILILILGGILFYRLFFPPLDTKPCQMGVTGAVVDGNEPPPNPFAADSPWPMTHRNPYCQASSPLPGPTDLSSIDAPDFINSSAGLITVAFSGPYPGGARVIWGSTVLHVFKASPCPGGAYYDRIFKDHFDLLHPDKAISGAYTLVDVDGTFFVPSLNRIYAYRDRVPGDPVSGVAPREFFEIPQEWLQGEEDIIVGLTLTYDGMLALATKWGTVGVVSRSFDRAHYLWLGKEEISNSVAADEDGGIYVVTAKKMYRVQWTGTELTTDPAKGGWSAGYETGDDVSELRLGAGSGATPTLMGVGDQDKFVVITDGQKLMHLVLFWRDRIPEDWEQIPGTRDRRIAAQMPVTFGDPDAHESLSEQSVCVRGYGALVVNNKLKVPMEGRLRAILKSGDPAIAPYGAEKFVWDPQKRRLETAWVNREISLPNGIPCMSAATNLIYDIGQRDGAWTMEALDWDTGVSVWHAVMGHENHFNSAYAATEIGPGSGLYSGTFMGMVRFLAK